jgi:Family of unknown function (DUF6390)
VRRTGGPVLFARYAYPPNALGYCGPADSAAVGEYAAAGVDDVGLVALARQFAGAWPYLQLIAGTNHRADPLDAAVVEAYWLGNRLLERIPAAVFAADLEERFRSRIGAEFTDLATLAVLGGRAHHNFHVFAVYPWVGLLRAGRAEEPLRVLDSCRVRWGRVLTVHSGLIEVESRHLYWDGRALSLGPPSVELAKAARGARARPGDTVSLHWDWVCDVIDARQAAALRHYTRTQLEVTNTTLRRPAAAAVLN